MKKARALSLCYFASVLAFLPLVGRAQRPSTPPVSEILTWIGQHFETPSGPPLYPGDDIWVEQFKTSMTFQGCSVAISTVFHRSITKSATGQFDGSWEVIDSASLDLSKGLPDKISVGADDAKPWSVQLKVNFAQPLAWREEVKSSPPPQDLTAAFHRNVVVINFATQDMANRQAKAWHDAILACGGKAVPDNLY